MVSSHSAPPLALTLITALKLPAFVVSIPTVLQLVLLVPLQDVYVIAESEESSLEYESISQ